MSKKPDGVSSGMAWALRGSTVGCVVMLLLITIFGVKAPTEDLWWGFLLGIVTVGLPAVMEGYIFFKGKEALEEQLREAKQTAARVAGTSLPTNLEPPGSDADDDIQQVD